MATIRSWKGQGTDSLLESLEGIWLSQKLGFCSSNTNFGFLASRINNKICGNLLAVTGN